MKNYSEIEIEQRSDALLNMAGISYSGTAGYKYAGVSKQGRDIFIKESLANSNNLKAGAFIIHFLKGTINPFKVLTKKEDEQSEHLASISGNPKLIAALDKAQLDRSGEKFGSTILAAVKANVDHTLGVVSALRIYDHWGVMSPAQKSIAIAVLGIQTHETTESRGPVCDLKIVSGKGQTFTVKNALDLLKAGKNPYSLVQNWNQIRQLLKVFHGTPTTEAMADFASSHNLINTSSPKDQAVPGVSADKIKAAGAKPAPQYGVGSLATPSGSRIPGGYAQVAQTPGGDIITPKPNIATSAGALAGSLTGTQAGTTGISSDAIGAYNKWEKTDKKDKGSEGGSSFISGLAALKLSNPYLFGALVAFLTKYSYSLGKTSEVYGYTALLAGTALARIVSGKVDAKSDKEGAAIALKLLSKTPNDWVAFQKNLKGLYASFGVSSKADAYQLSNQAYSEDRISESDLVAMHEVFNVVYDKNGMEVVEKLLMGQARGIEVAKQPEDNPSNTMTANGARQNIDLAVPKTFAEKNKAKYKTQQPEETPEEAPAQEEPEAQGAGVANGL